MEISEKQINYIVWQVKSYRSDELKTAFPDDIQDGANYWQVNLEKKLQSLTRETASEIITMLRDEDPDGFTYLIEQLNQINN